MRNIFEMARMVGRRHVEQGVYWLPSATTYGAAGVIGLIYFTDWRVVVDYIPFYNGKFKKLQSAEE